jgi:hypothetical protein
MATWTCQLQSLEAPPVGTILLPGFLLLLHSPFMFGYAKPVPVKLRLGLP